MELFVGAIISLISQAIKKVYKDRIVEEWQDAAILGTLILFSFLGALIYQVMVDKGLWDGFLHICVNAAGIWALFIKRFEKKDK